MARHIATRRQLQDQFSREVRIAPAGVAVAAEEAVFLERVLAIANEHLGDAHFGADALAAAVGASPRHLRRRLRALTGESPAALLRRLRLERAAQLLDARVGTVAEVAHRVGFNDPAYFSPAYRKHFGHSPSTRPSPDA